MRTQEFLTKVEQPVTMRVADSSDRPAIERLAALDSQTAPQGDLLVAEVGGEIQAAVAVEAHTAIADPFRPTAGVVSLLRKRAAQVAEPQQHGHAFRLLRAA